VCVTGGIEDHRNFVFVRVQHAGKLVQQAAARFLKRPRTGPAVEEAEVEQQIVAIDQVRDGHASPARGKKREAWLAAYASSVLGTAEGTAGLGGLVRASASSVSSSGTGVAMR